MIGRNYKKKVTAFVNYLNKLPKITVFGDIAGSIKMDSFVLIFAMFKHLNHE